MRGSTRAHGTLSPSRLKPGALGCALAAGLELGLEQRVGAEPPVAGQASRLRWPSASRSCGSRSLGGRVDAQAEGVVGAEALAQVDARRARCRARATRARRCAAALASGRLTTKLTSPPGALVPAWMPLVPLSTSMRALLSSGIDGLGVDRQAVAPVVEAVVEHEAAHRQEVPVALGVVGVAHGWRRSASGRTGAARRGPCSCSAPNDAGLQRRRATAARRRSRPTLATRRGAAGHGTGASWVSAARVLRPARSARPAPSASASGVRDRKCVGER